MFKQRISRPTSKDKFYIRATSNGYSTCVIGKPTDSQCNVLCNCVGYACGRFNEIYSELTGYKGMKFPNLNCNAEDFPERAKKYYKEIEFGKTPKPGAIIVWSKGKVGVSSDGAGHVAIVERVNNDGTLTITESGYNSFVWKTTVINNKNGRWNMNSSYTFRGFLYNPAVTDKMIKDYEEENKKQTYPGTFPTGILSSKSGTVAQIKLWQKFLNWFGNYNLIIDGDFGPKTKSATIDFQVKSNLEADGIVGNATINAAKKFKK